MRKHRVGTLSDSSLASLANLIVSSIGYNMINNNPDNVMYNDIDNEISVVMVEISSYLESAGTTSNIYQDLLRVILGSDYLEASMRFICLQMLLNCSVHCLITDIFPFSYYERILQIISVQGSGLRTLNLKGVWVKEDHMHYLFDIVKKCTNLTRLYIPYIADDNLLEVIAENCEKLHVLDVSGETDITEIGVEALSKGICAKRLTVIDIGVLGEENICHSDIAMLLENCSNLETLATYAFVGAALKFVHDNVDENFKSKLKYLHDTKTDSDTLKIIVKTCPHLDSIYLDTPNVGILTQLEKTSLRKLKIYKFYCNELLQLLEKNGKNLAHLTLIKGTGILEIGKLARYCSALLDLDCYVMNDMKYTIDIKFDRLQGLEMLSCPMSQLSLKNFICSNTTIKRLAVDAISFTDDDIANIFIPYNFDELEDLWFTTAPNLTIVSVETLMECCPELQSIGQLSGWSLTPDDLALIRGILRSGNSSLILSPTSLFP